MIKKVRIYKGCELESPIYRQILAEQSKKLKLIENEYKTKRGKQSLHSTPPSKTNVCR